MAKASHKNQLSIGIDAVSIARMKASARNPRFIERVFTEKEAAYCLKRQDPSRHLSGRFAAKEAVIKALGDMDGFGWKDIEVVRKKDGRPRAAVRSEAKKILGKRKIFLSIAYSKEIAIAFAAVERTG